MKKIKAVEACDGTVFYGDKCVVQCRQYEENLRKDADLSQRQLDRIDNVYHSVYDCILTIINKNNEEYEWDISVIGPITEDIVESLLNMKVVDKIYFPHVIHDSNGESHIKNFYRLEEN